MLEDIPSSFFDSTDCEEGVGQKNPESVDERKGGLTDDFGSLFADLIGESLISPIDMNEIKDSDNRLEPLDSDDEEIPLMDYLAEIKSVPYRSSTGTVPKKGSKLPENNRSTHDIENNRNDSLRFAKIPHINIDKLEENGKCTSKNALNARINRMRKKQYINDLESNIDELTTENRELKQTLLSKTSKLEEAQKEIGYLRSVISNQNGLMSLLNNISNTAGVKLNASLVFANSDSENNNIDISSDEKKSPVASQSGYKRPLDMTDSSDSVSVKKTKNGLYLVNERESKVPDHKQNQSKILKETNYNDGNRMDMSPQTSQPLESTSLEKSQHTTAKHRELRTVKAKRTDK